ncbi:MAG: energy transducer TonB [Puniceicoccaceae bacterium]
MPNGNNRLVGYKLPRSNKYVIRIVIATIIMTLAILAILPFTQALSGDPRDRNIRSVDVANLPPPEPPPPEPPPPEEEEEEEVEDLEEPPPMLDLSKLDASLNPGTGNALFGGFDLSQFKTTGRSAVEDMKIFSLRELDRQPRRKKTILPQYPIAVRRDGVEGVVKAQIMIDEEGRVTIMQIVESPDVRLSDVVRDALEQWIFEPPIKDGKAVRAQYIQPIPFNL